LMMPVMELVWSESPHEALNESWRVSL